MKSFTFPLNLFEGESTKVDLGRGSAWVIRNDHGAVTGVIENKCAHMGSALRSTKAGFQCDSHNWTYDKLGRNDVNKNPSLNSLEFVVNNQEIQIFVDEDVNLLSESQEKLDGTEFLELVSHATFLLETSDYNVMFDPWIKGDTYWGAWTLFPQNSFDYSRLDSVDCLVITHPHPDHFHPETLQLFSRDTKILLPAFPSRILPDVLTQMGFTNFQEIEWEVEIKLSEKISMSFLRPNTFWEDSAVLVQVGNFIWLNQNDSGASLKDNKIPKSLDLLTTSFDVGASGYPLTWEMASERQARIVENGKQQILESIKSRCQELEAKNFAPFAGYWRHGLAAHQRYADSLHHTSIADLRILFLNSKTNLIPTIPSSRLNLLTLDHTYRQTALDSLNNEYLASKTQIQFDAKGLSREEITSRLSKHLNDLKLMSIATNTEYVKFKIKVPELQVEVCETFGNSTETQQISIEVSISPEIAELVTSGDPTATWNHIDIGYLGSWKRQPDIYPVNFMRLLQLGYVHQLATDTESLTENEILSQPVARAIESNPELARIVLNRAGLPCAACGMANRETIEEAIRIHKVGANQREILIAELKGLLV